MERLVSKGVLRYSLFLLYYKKMNMNTEFRKIMTGPLFNNFNKNINKKNILLVINIFVVHLHLKPNVIIYASR